MFTAVFFAAVNYYEEKFAIGTYINGIYCTGKTVEEVNEELKKMHYEDTFVIEDLSGRSYEYALSEISYIPDYSSALSELLTMQKDDVWYRNITDKKEHTISATYTFDKDKLSLLLSESLLFAENVREAEVKILYQEGYVLLDSTKDVFCAENVLREVESSLENAYFKVNISSCYQDIPYTEEMQAVLNVWSKVNDFQTCNIVYDMGDEEIALGTDITSKWILKNEDGSFSFSDSGELLLDEAALESFIDELCAAYNTYNTARVFASSRGEDVIVEGGTYGTVIDRASEIAYLKDAFLKQASEIHVPKYEKEGYVRGKDDIGDTYIEVDIPNQKLYFYKAGELLVETDIVTGNLKRGMGTPDGVYYIYNMETNRILRGGEVPAFVYYWMPIYKGVGLHDATWRKKFGGDIYKTDGSHGCINIPKNVTTTIYEEAEVGLPVIVLGD